MGVAGCNRGPPAPVAKDKRVPCTVYMCIVQIWTHTLGLMRWIFHKRRCLRFSAGLVTAHTNQHQIHRLETNLFINYSFDVDSCQLWSIDVKDEHNWGNKGTTISLAFIWIGKNAIWSDSVGRSKAARTTTYKELKKRSTRSLFFSDFEFVKLCVLACVCCGCARAHATSFPCGNKIRLEKKKEKRKKERCLSLSYSNGGIGGSINSHGVETALACPSHNRITFEIVDEKEWKCIKRSYFFMALIVSGFFVTYIYQVVVFSDDKVQPSYFLSSLSISDVGWEDKGKLRLFMSTAEGKWRWNRSSINNDNDCDRCSIDSKCVPKIKQKKKEISWSLSSMQLFRLSFPFV